MNPHAEKKGLSAAVLKGIAAVTMFIDHATYVFFLTWYWRSHRVTVLTRRLYYILRGVGRIAFPIYCFLLVEGFRRTRSVKNYFLRLSAFALISEIPFDLAFNKGPFDWSDQNVFFTLALGLAAVWAWDTVTRSDQAACPLSRLLLAAAAAGALAYAAYLIKSDYDWRGVLVIMLMHICRDDPAERFGAAGPALLLAGKIEAASWPDFLLFDLYNGQRGRQNKYFFYAFYPGHLLFLTLIRALARGGAG